MPENKKARYVSDLIQLREKVIERNLERDQLTPVFLSSQYHLRNHKDLLIFP